jgi:AcrR family transcriptional regulator
MSDNKERRGREHNAEASRRAILNAAEEVFSTSGFVGARVDEIAARAGYNKSLLFQYFGDKLNLYTEVLKRADQATNHVRAQLLSPLFMDDKIATDRHRFEAFLKGMIRANFDYLVEHPRVLRILMWEMADNWKTYAKISPQFSQEELEPFEKVCRNALEAGLLRSDFAPIIQLTIMQPLCQIFLAYLPIYQLSFPNENMNSSEALDRAREFIVNLIVSGIFCGPND